ncbi:MAG: alpha/beta hydrolase fold domain-containing protein [Acidimicrobiia bacterium]
MPTRSRRAHGLRAALAATALLLAACRGDDTTAPVPSDPPAATATATATANETTSTAATVATETTSTDATNGRATSTTVPAWSPLPDVSNIEYASQSDAQRLDLYLPPDAEPPLPLLVFIHGGAWMAGDKRNEYAAGVVPLFVGEGYAVASVNYRLSDEAVFPAQLLDVKAAIRWLRANAPTYGIDPNRIAAAGESAGAHLAALLGTTTGVPNYDDPGLGNAGVSSAVSAVVDWYGPVDLIAADAQLAANPACAGALRPADEPDPASTQLLGAPPADVPELAAAANPITYLIPDRVVPPFLIEHGDVDCVVPYQGSVALHEEIEALFGPGRSQLVIVPGSGHYTAFDAAGQVATVLAFLAATIGAPAG